MSSLLFVDATERHSPMKNFVTVYWLIPAAPYHEFFRRLIRILAGQFEAPRFEPHLTILATVKGQQPPGKILRQISASPLRLKVRDISFSSKFTKTLFVRLEQNKPFEKLILDLARAARSRAKPPADPHLSFLYRKMPPSMKKELTRMINLPFGEVLFDSIKAMQCASPTTTDADVEAWRVVATKSLRS